MSKPATTGVAVAPDDLPPADLSENARIILGRRYLKKDEGGRRCSGGWRA